MLDFTFFVFVALSITIIVNIVLSYRDRQRQIKVDTANLLFKLPQIADNLQLDTAMESLQGNIKNIRSDFASIYVFYETIATLWDGKTLNEEYVKSFFGRDLKQIKDNESIMNFLNVNNEKLGYLAFPNLAKLLEHSKTWK